MTFKNWDFLIKIFIILLMIIVITGPTSSGKTGLALSLAKILNTELINADSRQVYKYLDIGTNKLPIDKHYTIEQYDRFWVVDGIKINLYDMCTPDTEYTVSHFINDATTEIDRLLANDMVPIIVGGTGFYINSLFNPQPHQSVPKNNNLRLELEKLEVDELQKLIPVQEFNFLNESDRYNPRRLIRKIEIFDYLENNKFEVADTNRNYFNDVIFFGLTNTRDNLYKNADIWITSIWNDLINEIKYLNNLGYKDTIPMKGIIYKTAQNYLEMNDRLDDSEAIEKIQFDLHNYIRKQQTFLNKLHNIKWFDKSTLSNDQILQEIIKSINLD